jgi:tripartite-type tricarboxylate transporter receptor subunit TctC
VHDPHRARPGCCLRRALCVLLPALFLVAGAGAPRDAAAAESGYPTRPIRLLVPFPPGGSTDLVARFVAPVLQAALGQPVVVDNHPGAGGTIAGALAATAAPDGYTLVIEGANLPIGASLYRHPGFNARRDLVPVAMVCVIPLVLVVNAALDAHSVPELQALLERRPGQLNFGSNGTGATPHLTGELFRLQTGTRFVHVPYKGAPQMDQALASGEIDFAFDSIAPVLPLIKGGRVRALAVTTPVRHPALPEVPTLVELGYPKVDVSSWFGLMSTAGTPPPIIERLAAAVGAALQVPALRAQLERQGALVRYLSPAAFGAYLEAEFERWAPVVQASGAVID